MPLQAVKSTETRKQPISSIQAAEKEEKLHLDELDQQKYFQRDLLLFCGVFLVSLVGIVCFFRSAPPLPQNTACNQVSLKFLINGVLPTWVGGRGDKLGTVKTIWQCATDYKKDYPGFTLMSFCVVYISLQTFAIPGPIVLSILSGALYPFFWAQVLVSFCATTGASLCFLISFVLGRRFVRKFFSSMLTNFEKKIAENRENLFYYHLFLRLTPLLPNWFVNVASPLVQVDYKIFFLSTFIGLIPANFIHVSTGATLNNATNNKNNTNFYHIGVLFILQFLALLPTLFKKKLANLQEKKFK